MVPLKSAKCFGLMFRIWSIIRKSITRTGLRRVSKKYIYISIPRINCLCGGNLEARRALWLLVMMVVSSPVRDARSCLLLRCLMTKPERRQRSSLADDSRAHDGKSIGPRDISLGIDGNISRPPHMGKSSAYKLSSQDVCCCTAPSRAAVPGRGDLRDRR